MILCFSLFLVCLWRKKKRNLFSECLFFFSSRLTRGKNHRTEWEWEDATRICEPPPDVRRRHKTRGVPPPTHKSPLSRIFPRLSDTYFYIIYWNTTSKYLSSHSFEMWIVNFFFWIESRSNVEIRRIIILHRIGKFKKKKKKIDLYAVESKVAHTQLSGIYFNSNLDWIPLVKWTLFFCPSVCLMMMTPFVMYIRRV